MPSGRKNVFGLQFSPHSYETLAQMICRDWPQPGAEMRTLLTANVDHIVNLRTNPDFVSAYRSAWQITADGAPVFFYAMLRGAGPAQRVTGADLFAQIMSRLEPEGGARPFFVCSANETGERLSAFLRGRGFPAAAIAYVTPPWGFERDTNTTRDLLRAIAEHRTTHLFFGVGAPKSEIWLHRNRESIKGCYALSVGAGLDFLAETKARAPVLLRRTGLEWSWRLATEPRRLWKRYILHSWPFLIAIAEDLSGYRVAGRGEPLPS